jgi:hypothetical protein
LSFLPEAETKMTETEQQLIKEIALTGARDRINRLRTAFNHVIEARNACRDFRHSLPPDLREQYGISLVTIETLCNFALIDAEKAGVKGLKEWESEKAGREAPPDENQL